MKIVASLLLNIWEVNSMAKCSIAIEILLNV